MINIKLEFKHIINGDRSKTTKNRKKDDITHHHIA